MLPCFNIHYKTRQTTMKEYLPPARMLIIKNTGDNMPVKMWRKVTTLILLVGMTRSTAILENSMEVPQRIENRLSAILSPDMYQKEMKLAYRRDIRTPVFTVALFIIAKTWE